VEGTAKVMQQHLHTHAHVATLQPATLCGCNLRQVGYHGGVALK